MTDLMPLPDAEVQCPACGACGGETNCYDVGTFTCDDCLLTFHGDAVGNLRAEYTDDRDKPCRAACDNTWHRDGAIAPASRFECHPCALPAGHTSDHWNGCRAVVAEPGGSDRDGVENGGER